MRLYQVFGNSRAGTRFRMQAQESSLGELLLKTRGTYLKDSVETVSGEPSVNSQLGRPTNRVSRLIRSLQNSKNERPEALNTSIRSYREEKELRKKLAQL